MLFDDPILRFGTSGTLIGLYGVTEALARRAGARSDRPGVSPPRWLKPVSFVLLGGFYLLIAPTGGALLGGAGNLVGIALALVAMVLRYAVRNGSRAVRHPATAARLLFYAALPLAVGVSWGWLVLTLPSLAISAYLNLREERLTASHGRSGLAAHRWIPGVW